MKMKILLQLLKIYNIFALILTFPFIIFAKIPIWGWQYYYTAIFVSKLPGLIGDLIRYHFYKFNLKKLGKDVKFMYGVVIEDNRTEIGDNVLINMYTQIDWVIIKSNIMIGKFVVILPGPHSHNIDRTDIYMNQQPGKDEPATIEDDVWIGSNVTVLKTIKQGTVVGAGSVVTKTFEEYDVIGGVPAKKIKNRKNV
jgi:acetyltransferase-like isoleucine patch superfamily enzyme